MNMLLWITFHCLQHCNQIDCKQFSVHGGVMELEIYCGLISVFVTRKWNLWSSLINIGSFLVNWVFCFCYTISNIHFVMCWIPPKITVFRFQSTILVISLWILNHSTHLSSIFNSAGKSYLNWTIIFNIQFISLI